MKPVGNGKNHGGTTMIDRLEIQNYKALRNVALDLTPIHVLIGPNDSGKTSILEALQILSRTTNTSISKAMLDAEPSQVFTFGDASRDMRFTARIKATGGASGDISYAVEVKREGTGWKTSDSIALWDTVSIPSSTDTFKTSLHLFNLDADNRFRTRDRGTLQEDFLKSILNSIDGIQTYRWIPRHLALPVGLSADREYRMEESGFGLPTLLNDIVSNNRKQFDSLEQSFQEIFPEVESISTPTQKGYASAPSNGQERPGVDGKGLVFKFKHIETPLSAGSVSDGYLIILAYLALLHTPQPPPMLLIEEPENGVHPKRLAEIVKMLRSLTEREDGPQILLTTHSPYLIDCFKPEEVSLCTKEADGTVATRNLSESEVVRQESGVFTLGEIWSGEDAESLFPSSSKAGAGE